MKYSILNNTKYVYSYAFKIAKKLKTILPIFIIISIIIPVITTVIPSIAVKYVTEDYGVNDFVFVIVGIFLIYGFLLYLQSYFVNVIEYENIATRMQGFYVDYSVKLMKTDYTNVEPQEKQVLIQKALNSLTSNWVGLEFLMKNIPVFVINFIGLILYGVFISVLHPIIILILVGMSLLNYLLNRYAQIYEDEHKKDYAKVDRHIEYLYDHSTSLINGKDVRIYKMKHWFYQIFKVLIKKRIKWTQKIEYRYFLPAISDNILLFIRDIIAYSMLVNLVLNNTISVATFTLYIGFIAGFSTWLHNAVTAFSNLKRANLGVNDYRRFMEIDEVFNHQQGLKLPEVNDYPLEIEFQNVSFCYPGSKEYTLKDVNFKIERGSKIALVGNNGAGKTTLVKLLTGLYHPTEGEILVNGKAIKDYNVEEYQRLIGAVFQEVQTLAFTIAKNVACTKDEEIDYKRVWKSLELAGLKDKVESLKDKEKTYLTQYISKNGIQLSGGEMQKLMLARLIYNDAPIMVLDEPTAALDPLAEEQIYEKYNELTLNKTSLFISHRLASTKFCDRILFLDHGSIIEDGTHTELMKVNGKYAHMFDIQSHYYKEKLKEGENA